MTVGQTLLHPVHAFVHPSEELAAARAESRMSAYVYGDILVLAATAGVTPAAIRSGEALLVILGTMASTYIAHVLADVVGAVFAGHSSPTLLRAEARDSVPVMSAGGPSFVLLGAAALGWPSAGWAQALACAILVLRLAAIGLVYRRHHQDISVPRAVWFGIVVAVIAAVAATLKLTLTH